MLDKNKTFMMIARTVALHSSCNSRKIGCVITGDDNIIATGYNTHTNLRHRCTLEGPTYCYRRHNEIEEDYKFDYCRVCHAEVHAVGRLANNNRGYGEIKAFVTLHPCMSCLKLLSSVGIDCLLYEMDYEFNKTDSASIAKAESWRAYAKSLFFVEKLDMSGVDLSYIRVFEKDFSRRLLKT
jgi:dCMP deaminase